MAAALLVLTACTDDEAPALPQDGAQEITITVSDGGYGSTTRTTENGYTTMFTDGDACGLFVVRNEEVVHENVKLTKTSSGWELETAISAKENDNFFLYYPYKGYVDHTSSATDDAGFFSSLISYSHKVIYDQSTYANYTASDLMTAKGTATKSGGKLNLSFSMTHRMALAVIEVPQGANITWTAARKPWAASDGTYRYIVRPSSSNSYVIKGTYSNWNKTTFNVVTGIITAGTYKTYKVDGGKATQISTINVGDFILQDGTILPKDTELSAEQKANVRAIVFWTPAETTSEGRTTPASLTDDKVMAADFPTCTRGLAVAIKNVSTSTTWQKSSHDKVFESVSEKWSKYELDGRNYRTPNSGTGTEHDLNKVYGYQDTKVLTAYNKNLNNSVYAVLAQASIVEPADKLSSFSLTSPTGSTGWFLPSVKELHMLCYKDVDDVYKAHGSSGYTETRDIVNASISAAGGDALSGYYWSSLEYPIADSSTTYNDDEYAFCVNFSTAEVTIGKKVENTMTGKKTTADVRAVCAF